MRKAAIISYYIYLVWMLFTFTFVSYGHGLGDLFYHGINVVAFIVITIIFILGLKIKSASDVLYIFMFLLIYLTIVGLTLKFTY